MMAHWPYTLQDSGSQSVVSGPAALPLPGKLFKMQIIRSQNLPTESGTLGDRTQKSVFTRPPSNSVVLKLENQ